MDLKKSNQIIIAMSGGIDSSYSAYLLKKMNKEPVGIFMQNWDEYANNDFLGHTTKSENTCNVQKDYDDVLAVAKKLNIQTYRIDFIKQYWNYVFKYTIESYKKGLTPNPDILCNKYIKFGQLYSYVDKKFNSNIKIATGHYARVLNIKGINYLAIPKDKNKDQTYFLCGLNQEQLDRCCFPLANIKKTNIKKQIKKLFPELINKKESMGICFIGERKFEDFLKNYIKPHNGNIINIVDNKKLGTHNGQMYYTIGQNRNLHLGGMIEKMFVCKKDVAKNIVYVCSKQYVKKYLYSEKCTVNNFNWINGINNSLCQKIITKNKKVKVRFRHRQKLLPATFLIENNKLIIEHRSAFAVTPGQYAVLYYKGICLGGGEVSSIYHNHI